MRGFTLVELMVAVSIIAVLSTVGVTAFSKAQVRARDTTRKNDLRQIQTALDLYYEDKHEYPRGDGISSEATCYPVNIPEQLRSVPKDPQTGEDYCYLGDMLGRNFILWAKLENLDERNDSNDRRLEGYNYFIAGNETFLVQKSDSVNSRIIAPTDVSITPPAPINRIDQSSCLIWINGNASSRESVDTGSFYPAVVGSSVAVTGTLPGKFDLQIDNSIIPPPRPDGFTKDDVFIYTVPPQVDTPHEIVVTSRTNSSVKCSRILSARSPNCSGQRQGEAPITIYVVRDNNFEPDQWPVYNPKNICTAANLPAIAFNKFTAFAGKMISSPAVLGVTSSDCNSIRSAGGTCTCNSVFDGELTIPTGQCDGGNRCLTYACDLASGNSPVCNATSKVNATACGIVDGKQGYCFSSVCRFDTCGSNSDCADNNACTTNESCGGFATSLDDNKSRGLCSATQAPANTICATQGNQPTMLCSGGTNSQCNVPYAQCTKASDSTATCCGTTNIQIPDSCRTCDFDKRSTISSLETGNSGIGGVAVWVKDSCGKQYTKLTESNGIAEFTHMPGKHNYPVGYKTPRAVSFTRGYSMFISTTFNNEIKEFLCYGGKICQISGIEALLHDVNDSTEGHAARVGIGLK